MPRQIRVDDVTELGNGRFAVRLSVGEAEGSLSQTQTVSADGPEAAVQAAKEAFARWLDKVTDYVLRSMPSKMRN